MCSGLFDRYPRLKIVSAETGIGWVNYVLEGSDHEWERRRLWTEGLTDRFIPQCIVPLWPIERTVAKIQRAVRIGHRGVIFPAIPMELRKVPHINEAVYDPVWATCQDLISTSRSVFTLARSGQSSSPPGNICRETSALRWRRSLDPPASSSFW